MAGSTVFDPAHIMTMVSDDRELAAQVIGVFLVDIPKQLRDLDEAIATGDSPTAQRVTHSIKGAAATVGAEELRAVAYEGEILGRDGKLDELRKVAVQLGEKYAAASRAMLDEGFEPTE